MKFTLITIMFSVLATSSHAQTSSLYIRGTGNNYSAARQVILNDINLVSSGRGLSLTIIDAATHTHVSSTIYDTYGSTVASNNLATALNGVQRGFIGILTSHDAWEGNVTPELRQAAQRLGLFKLAGGPGSGYSRRPYAAIFRGSGTPTDNSVPGHIAYEVMQSDDADAERAIIATMLIGDAFIGSNLTNALVAGNGSVKGAPVLVNHLGYVGIGTATPGYLLQIGADTGSTTLFSVNGQYSDVTFSGIHTLGPIWNFTNTGTGEGTRFYVQDANNLANRLTFDFRGNGGSSLILAGTSTGNVGIGTTTPDAKLAVKGTIHTQEVRVDLNGSVAPDFVFEEDYALPALHETEAYIKANKHLPGIPSATEMEENGLNLKEMNLMLLQKVEELTLHLIEMKKENEEQKKINQFQQVLLNAVVVKVGQ